VGRVHHSEENRESSLLDIVGVLDAVDGRSPVDAQAPHLIGFHDRMGRVEPSVTDEGEEEDGGLAKLERLVVLENVADTADERRLGRVEPLQGLDGDGSGGVGQRTKGILDGLVVVLTTPGGQVEVVIQEREDILRILDPWEELVPFVGSVHGQASSFPFLLRGIGGRDGGLHDDVEQLITLLGDIVFAEGSDQLHGHQRAINLLGGGVGAPEGRRELVVDPGDLGAAFVTVEWRLFSLASENTCDINLPLVGNQQVIDV